MPTFTAIALDRLLEPGTSKSVEKSVSSKSEPPKHSTPVHNSKVEGRNNSSATERKIPRHQITPALYATPDVTPLPDSPSSFPPSPYIINHKRRGPRLLKSSSGENVSSNKKSLDDEEMQEKAKHSDVTVADSSVDISGTLTILDHIQENANGFHDGEHSGKKSKDSHVEKCNVEVASSCILNEIPREKNESLDVFPQSPQRNVESEDFFDPQESMSFASVSDGEDTTGTELSMKITHSGGEFFDAWEELSSSSGIQSSRYNVEAELREIRLTLLLEIEKRKQAEESLDKMRTHWERIRKQLSLAGLSFPVDPSSYSDGDQSNFDPAEELCQQVQLVRFVSETIGRGIAKAEAEIEMEAQIELKNFEITRLSDRLKYYETVNQEMCQRNQESMEMTRRERQRRKMRQKWIWGSIAAAIVLGTATIAWSFFPMGNGSSSNGHLQVPDHEDADN